MLIGLALLLLAVRTWIALGHRLPIGALGSPNLLLGNKLSGWLHGGTQFNRWSLDWFLVSIFWEWLPAALFGWGLWQALAQVPTLPRLPYSLRRSLSWLVPLVLFTLATGISQLCFSGIPHVQDSIAQQIQARIFASGRVYALAPEHGEFFPYDFLVEDRGHWYAQYPPMQPLLLALGVLADVPWLVNPLLGALSAFFIYQAARRAYGASVALPGLLLLLASPFVWFMSGEGMNHAGTLFFVTAGLFTLAPALARRPAPLSTMRWALAGLLFGLAMSTRPLCGLAVAFPLAAIALWPDAPNGKAPKPFLLRLWLRTPQALAFGLGIVAGLVPLFGFNYLTTGSPLKTGYQVQWGSSGWGFGKSQWGPPHTVARGLQHLFANWDGAARYLWEWPIPSLLPLAGLVFLRRRTRMDLALAGTLLVLSLAYLPYFFQDLCFGPRFLYAGVPAFVLLAARGIMAAGVAWSRRQRLPSRQGVRRFAQAAAFCSVIGLAVNVPLLARWYGNSYWGVSTLLADAVSNADVHHAVVFVRDYNRSRVQALRDLGVSLRVAHGAVEVLDPSWMDAQVASLQAGPGPDTRRAEELERRLQAAIEDPRRPHRRTSPPWIDYLGYSSNANLGLHANTPWLERQDVIYAVHLGDRNDVLLREYPSRSAWLYDYNQTTRRFELRPYRPGRWPTASQRELQVGRPHRKEHPHERVNGARRKSRPAPERGVG